MSHRSQRAGITLIELLVVMAVISMLVALMLPAVQMARASARTAQCANNLWQIGRAFQNVQTTTGFVPNQQVLFTALEPYMEQQTFVFTCPEVQDPTDVSYAANSLPSRYFPGLGNKVVALDANQATIFLTQTNNDWIDAIEPRHGWSVNVLHFDGRVDNLIVLADDLNACMTSSGTSSSSTPVSTGSTVSAGTTSGSSGSGNSGSTSGSSTSGSGSGSGGTTTNPPPPPPPPPSIGICACRGNCKCGANCTCKKVPVGF